MPRLWYPDEDAARTMIAEFTENVARDGLRLRLRGFDGRERLLSAIAQPRWGKYRRLPDKAAALHFFLNKGHPFIDGNKRFAIAAMVVFLSLNDAAFFATDDDVVRLALSVADGSMSFPESIPFVRERIVYRPRDWSTEGLQAWAAGLNSGQRALLRAGALNEWFGREPVNWYGVQWTEEDSH